MRSSCSPTSSGVLKVVSLENGRSVDFFHESVRNPSFSVCVHLIKLLLQLFKFVPGLSELAFRSQSLIIG